MPEVLLPSPKIGPQFQNPIPTSVGGLSMILKLIPAYITNKEERVPRRQLGPFTTDPTVYATLPQTGLRITWIGHSSMLVEIDRRRILIDPVWDDRASPVSWSGPKRFFPPPLPLSSLPPLDAILISHDHYDHLGKQTIQTLSKLPCASNAKWITSLGVGKVLENFGAPPEKIVELNWTESTTIGSDLTVSALPARHFSGRSLTTRFHTLWSSFALKGPQSNIYYGADSGLWDGFPEIAQRYGPFHLTMLEIGAYNDLWKSIHMGPDGAAQAFAAMGATGLLMPIHWGLFDLALHAWHQPIERITELAAQSLFKLWSPQPGLPTEVVKDQQHKSNWWNALP